MSAPVQATPAERLDRIVAALRAFVAEFGLAGGLAGPLIVLLSTRLARLAARFAAYAEAAPPARRRSQTARRAAGASPLPRRFAWLLRILPASATARAQLEALLAEPDMLALIETRPATGRALRPLCHLLGITRPPCLRLQRRRRAPRPDQPRPRAQPAPRRPAPQSPGLSPARRALRRPPRNTASWIACLGLRPDTG